jgi:hypothetical protein
MVSWIVGPSFYRHDRGACVSPRITSLIGAAENAVLLVLERSSYFETGACAEKSVFLFDQSGTSLSSAVERPTAESSTDWRSDLGMKFRDKRPWKARKSPMCRDRWLGSSWPSQSRGCSSGLVTALGWSHAVLPGQSSRAVGSSGIHRPSLGETPAVAAAKGCDLIQSRLPGLAPLKNAVRSGRSLRQISP